jgi:amino acid transporter
MNEIKGIQQLDALISTTYIFSVVYVVVFIFIAIIIASLIPWQGGSHDKSYVKRRVWFIILGCISFICFFCYNDFVVMERIKNVAFQAKFMNCIGISVGIIIGLYLIISFIIMKVFPKSKFGSIIGKNKSK